VLLKALARVNALVGEEYVVLSEHLEQVVRSHGARRVHNIPIYGVDTRIFAPPPVNKCELKQQLKLPTDGTLIFFSSRVAPEKDSETLLRAVRRLIDEGEQVWLLHRSGGYRQFLSDAERFGLREHVIATDAVHPHQELPLDYQACDICVQASREEGLGFSPLEALACETPVIATAVGGLKETIIDGRTGWSYPVGDDEALACALRDVIQRSDEAKSRAKAGRRLVQQRFDRAVVFEELVTLSEKVMRRSGIPIPEPQFGNGNHRSQISTQKRTIGHIGMPVYFRDAPFYRQNGNAMADSLVSALPASTTLSSATASQRKLNVVFAIHVSRDANTAVYRNTFERAQYLETLGHQCTILTPDDFPSVGILGGRLIPLLFPIAAASYIRSHSPAFDIAVFHSHAGWAVTLLRKFLGMFRDLRVGIIFHGLEPLYFSSLKNEVPLSWRYRILHGSIMSRILRFSCRSADTLVCLNSAEYRYLLENEWTPEHRISAVPNPAPEQFFIRREYRPSAKKILFLGQWLPMKGVRYLVQAYDLLRERHPELELICAGTMAPESTVLAHFPEHLRASISVLSRVDRDQLLDLHRQADVFVFPTLSEGFSFALAEAMASGLPIITTPVGAAPDVLQHEVSALLVPTRDSQALAAASERLINDATLRKNLGTRAQRAAERLRPEVCWRDYDRAFQLLVSTPSILEATR
jgi:glycosyltransferase involved in cell wall biosynthesis